MLTLLNWNFPQKGANSTSAEFYRVELESCNLDTILNPAQSFEASYVSKPCTLIPFRQRSTKDNTDFALVFNLERQSSNAFFADPVNSTNETIMLTGSPQIQGLTGDVYYWINHSTTEIKHSQFLQSFLIHFGCSQQRNAPIMKSISVGISVSVSIFLMSYNV
jgi:hypothetical protein